MICVLIAGRLRGSPAIYTGATGKPYAYFCIEAKDDEGTDVTCHCYTQTAADFAAVRNLSDGDRLAVSGDGVLRLADSGDGAPTQWLDVHTTGVLTAHRPRRRANASASHAPKAHPRAHLIRLPRG